MDNTQPLYGGDWLLPVCPSPFDLHGTSSHSFQGSDPAPHSDPRELIFSKLNQLENQIPDLQAAPLTRRGPASIHVFLEEMLHATHILSS